MIASFPTCPVAEVARLGRTLRSWRAQVLASFDTGGLSNGGTEAINLLIEKTRSPRRRVPQLPPLPTAHPARRGRNEALPSCTTSRDSPLAARYSPGYALGSDAGSVGHVARGCMPERRVHVAGTVFGVTLAALCWLFLLPSGAHASSVFVNPNSTDSQYASAARTRMSPLTNQTSATKTEHWVFIAIFLRNGDFYQVGWSAQTGCAGGAVGVFVYAQTVGGVVPIWNYYCSYARSTHTFEMRLTSNRSDGTHQWDSFIDGQVIPNTSLITSHDLGPNQPYVQSELPYTASRDVSMPRVQAYPAIQYRQGATYYDQAHGKVSIPTDTHCWSPYYYTVAGGGFNNAVLGDSSTGAAGCAARGESLW